WPWRVRGADDAGVAGHKLVHHRLAEHRVEDPVDVADAPGRQGALPELPDQGSEMPWTGLGELQRPQLWKSMQIQAGAVTSCGSHSPSGSSGAPLSLVRRHRLGW